MIRKKEMFDAKVTEDFYEYSSGSVDYHLISVGRRNKEKGKRGRSTT